MLKQHRIGIGIGRGGIDEFLFVLDLILDGLDRASELMDIAVVPLTRPIPALEEQTRCGHKS